MATGLLASTTLAGCSGTVQHAAPQIVAVPVKDTPPADLLICPAPAAAFPTNEAATIPEPQRAALKGLAISYRDLFDRNRRLVNWIAPGTCSAPAILQKE